MDYGTKVIVGLMSLRMKGKSGLQGYESHLEFQGLEELEEGKQVYCDSQSSEDDVHLLHLAVNRQRLRLPVG